MPRVTMHILFINFGKQSPNLGRDTCLAPEGFSRSICGPWPKKVVHHCLKPREVLLPPCLRQIKLWSTLSVGICGVSSRFHANNRGYDDAHLTITITCKNCFDRQCS